MKSKLKLITAFLMSILLIPTVAKPCTRVVYQGPENTVITARSMDWKDEIPANIWVFPRGMERFGEVGPNSISWTSKYGSVIASAFDIATADGMNEKGLVANLLWLVESEYPEYDGSRPGLSVALWVQYVLDNFASVSEAVKALEKNAFDVVSSTIPGTDKFTSVHLSVSDASGDNAIFEYIEGKLVIHHDYTYNVMTNSPTFEKQLALNEYWATIGGETMLPGTNRAADRFVRASHYIKAIPQTADIHIAVASTMSVIRNCSVPFGITSEEGPNISSTRWRSLSDQKNKVYFFETALTPSTFWIDLKKLDFTAGAQAMKLPLMHRETYAGEASENLVASKPFQFAGL